MKNQNSFLEIPPGFNANRYCYVCDFVRFLPLAFSFQKALMELFTLTLYLSLLLQEVHGLSNRFFLLAWSL